MLATDICVCESFVCGAIVRDFRIVGVPEHAMSVLGLFVATQVQVVTRTNEINSNVNVLAVESVGATVNNQILRSECNE